MPATSYAKFAGEVEEIYGLKAPATLCKMRQVLREFGALPGVRKTSDLRPVVVARWFQAHPDRSAATADSLLRSFRSAVAIGVASGYIRTSPFAVRIDPPEPAAGPGEARERHYSIAEIDAILTRAGEEARSGGWKAGRAEALVSTYAYAALRKAEALHLQWEDLDWPRHVLKVHPIRAIRHRLKTPASCAVVPMAPALEAVLSRWRPFARSDWVFPNVTRTNPWTGGPPGHKPLCAVKALGRRAGVAGVTILGFRHSFATHAPRWGLSREMVRAILRHTTIKTQEYYLHADVDDLVDAARKVSYRSAPASATA